MEGSGERERSPLARKITITIKIKIKIRNGIRDRI